MDAVGIKYNKDQDKEVEKYFSTYSNAYYKENYEEKIKNCYSYSHIVRKNHINKMIDLKDGKIVDIGCGPGVITYNLLLRGYEVWGIDISEAMINEARKKIEQTEFKDTAHFSVGDITSLQLPNDYFDVVVCSGVLEYLENKDELAIKEIYRILKPNGFAIIAVPTPQKKYYFTLNLLKSVCGQLTPILIKIKRKRINREYRGTDSIRNFSHNAYKPKELDHLLAINNFKKIDGVHYHFISQFLSLLAPSASLYFGEKLDKSLPRSKLFGWLAKGYIVKVKKEGSVKGERHNE